jgi:circadian clock protein KaiB
MLSADKATPHVTEFVLRLYVAGNSASSRRAEQNLDQLRMFMKADGWRFEIIDVLARPELAEQASILATPTLCYEHSGRPRRIVGDLSDTKRVLAFLGIEPKGSVA